jgi:hypothetical protein
VGTLHRVLGDLPVDLRLQVIYSFVCHVYECITCMLWLFEFCMVHLLSFIHGSSTSIV